jgi:hypothetical protein
MNYDMGNIFMGVLAAVPIGLLWFFGTRAMWRISKKFVIFTMIGAYVVAFVRSNNVLVAVPFGLFAPLILAMVVFPFLGWWEMLAQGKVSGMGQNIDGQDGNQ